MYTKIILLCTTLVYMHNPISCIMNIPDGYEDHSEFISKIPDYQLIRNLALIGSYRSAAVKSMDYVRTQNLTISDQLKTGIRVLDIHLRVVDDELKIYYGPVFMKYIFDDILDEVLKFMASNPRELIIMLLTVQFDHTLTDFEKCKVLDRYVAIWEQRGLKLVQDWSLLDDTVGEHRGHILLSHVRESDFATCSVYLPCEVQNNWEMTDEERKWQLVKEMQDKMLFPYHPYHSCYINYLASDNLLLYTDSTPEPNDGTDSLKLGLKEIDETNDRMTDYFRNPYDTLIMIVTEFPSQKLINKIINSNFN